jgi:3-methyladenine DNA glycosylase Tag
MIKSLIYCKMLVSYATNLKFISYQCTSFPKIQEEFGSFFAIHLGFCKSHTCYQLPKKLKKEVPATSHISDAISKDLKNADSNLWIYRYVCLLCSFTSDGERKLAQKTPTNSLMGR